MAYNRELVCNMVSTGRRPRNGGVLLGDRHLARLSLCLDVHDRPHEGGAARQPGLARIERLALLV